MDFSGFVNCTDVEHGPRFVMSGERDGVTVQVVTGYDITTDAWPYHVTVFRPDGAQRLTETPARCSARSKASAFEQGFVLALQALTPRTGFQREVKTDLSPR